MIGSACFVIQWVGCFGNLCDSFLLQVGDLNSRVRASNIRLGSTAARLQTLPVFRSVDLGIMAAKLSLVTSAAAHSASRCGVGPWAV